MINHAASANRAYAPRHLIEMADRRPGMIRPEGEHVRGIVRNNWVDADYKHIILDIPSLTENLQRQVSAGIHK